MYIYIILYERHHKAIVIFVIPSKVICTQGEYQYYIILYSANIFCDMCVCVCVIYQVFIYIDLVSTPETAIVYTIYIHMPLWFYGPPY